MLRQRLNIICRGTDYAGFPYQGARLLEYLKSILSFTLTTPSSLSSIFQFWEMGIFLRNPVQPGTVFASIRIKLLEIKHKWTATALDKQFLRVNWSLQISLTVRPKRQLAQWALITSQRTLLVGYIIFVVKSSRLSPSIRLVISIIIKSTSYLTNLELILDDFLNLCKYISSIIIFETVPSLLLLSVRWSVCGSVMIF